MELANLPVTLLYRHQFGNAEADPRRIKDEKQITVNENMTRHTTRNQNQITLSQFVALKRAVCTL